MSSYEQLVRNLSKLYPVMRGDGNAVLQRILSVANEMLVDRGCVDLKKSDVQDAVEASKPILRGRSGDTNVHLYLHAEDRVGIKFARAVLEHCDERTLNIIVSCEGPTPFTRKECDGKEVQFMQAKDLCVNKTRHALVPKHAVGRAPDGIDVHQLPRIFDTDPIVRYYGWPLGTVVKIDRKFGGHETIPYFRLVVPASN